MNTRSECFSKVARIILMLSTLLLAGGYVSSANAKQGCGYGWHRYHGYCVRNYHHGYWNNPINYPRYHNCWRNYWGQLRCR
jgi:hypothetical protein